MCVIYKGIINTNLIKNSKLFLKNQFYNYYKIKYKLRLTPTYITPAI
jgi:hypothetical protein